MKRIVAFALIAGLAAIGCDKATPTYTSPDLIAAQTPSDGQKAYAIGGIVMSVEKPSRTVGDARVAIVAGANSGAFSYSDASGAFALKGLAPGSLTLQISKAGFQTWEQRITVDGDVKVSAELFLEPPVNSSGAMATGRCNDGAWTWSTSVAGACVNNGGIAYGVCPGPLCKS